MVWGRKSEQGAYCRSLYKNFTVGQTGTIYTPINLNGSLFYPSITGGINIPGCASDPIRGMLVCPVKNAGLINQIIPQGKPVPPNFQDWCNPQEFTPYYVCMNHLYDSQGKIHSVI